MASSCSQKFSKSGECKGEQIDLSIVSIVVSVYVGRLMHSFEKF